VRVQTENGLFYTIQEASDLVGDAWSDHATHVTVPGNGAQQTFPVDFADPQQEIRVMVTD